MYEIGPFRLDPEAGVLTQDGSPLPLGGRAVAVLGALLRTPNEHVPKSVIFEAAWPGLVVEDINLAVQISAIRRVLARAPGGDRWVETLPRRGYRFVGPVSVVPGTAPPPARRTNMQRALTSFVGRDRELAEIGRLLPATRLLTLTGIGGIGKTRLAQQAALVALDTYRDGAWFVDLAPIAQADLVPSAVAQALGARAAPGRSAIDSVHAQLEGRHAALILDNCEHVLEACAQLVVSLLRRHAELTIIATSREPLHVSGEQIYPLPTLSLPDAAATRDAIAASEAVRLFVERARRHHPRFALSAALAPAVARLCIHLDGIPLALELAAARIASLSVAEIDAQISRHQTMRATLEWSHELLDASQRAVLRRCAAFAGGFGLEAAASVAGFDGIDGEAVTEVLSQLVDRSLVIADTTAAHARYRLLETMRAYALEKLQQSGELENVRSRHARYFAAYFERAAEAWTHMPDRAWAELYHPDLDNVRAAIDWASARDALLAARLAGGAGPMWIGLALWSESLERLQRATELPATRESEFVRARTWLWLGIRHEGAPDQALPALEQAATLYRACGNAAGLADALVRLARVHTTVGHYENAKSLLHEARGLLQGDGTPKALGLYHAAAGFLKLETGDLAGARRDYVESIAQYRRAGSDIPALVMLGNLANMTWAQGDLEGAAAAYAESIERLAALPAPRKTALGWAYCNYSGVLTEMGRIDEAREAARTGLPLFQSAEYLWLVVEHFALRAALAGNLVDAARLAGYSRATIEAKRATRQTNEARAWIRLEQLLRAGLQPKRLERLLEEGETLTNEDALRLSLEG